jgi:hypothetical protein
MRSQHGVESHFSGTQIGLASSKIIAVRLVFLLLAPLLAFGQTVGPCGQAKFGTLICSLPNLINGTGLQFPKDTPTGIGAFVTPLTSSLPVPSPASGFIYTFDPSAGVFVRSSESFGPILTERADTIGRNKLSVGFTFQRFVFDKIDGINLHSVPLVIDLPGLAEVRSKENLNLQLNQFTMFATYGLTNRFDVSVAVPFSTVNFGLAYSATISPFPQSGNPGQGDIPIFAQGTHTATGLGDVNLQLKGTVLRGERGALALGAAVRLPTGDEYQALGAGAAAIKPFVAGSLSYKRISPHANLGYQVNGKSVLTGNIFTSEKRYIPNQIQYATGVDAGVIRRLTLDFDILGAEVIHGDRLTTTQGFIRRSYNITNGAAGFKVNPVGNLLFIFNMLFRLNDGGLRSKIAPLVGLSYAF